MLTCDCSSDVCSSDLRDTRRVSGAAGVGRRARFAVTQDSPMSQAAALTRGATPSLGAAAEPIATLAQIGRASYRERVWISVVAVSFVKRRTTSLNSAS